MVKSATIILWMWSAAARWLLARGQLVRLRAAMRGEHGATARSPTIQKHQV